MDRGKKLISLVNVGLTLVLNINMLINLKKVIVKAYCDWQISMQASGVAHPTVFLYKILEAIPGNTINHKGKSFK